jgi:hypothetical protein
MPMTNPSPTFLSHRAERMRELAREIVDEHGQRELIGLAAEYDRRAAEAMNAPGTAAAA